jgi:ATP-dependent DNA helicase RecG
MARFLMDKHPAHVEPLIRRWLGLRDHYSNA